MTRRVLILAIALTACSGPRVESAYGDSPTDRSGPGRGSLYQVDILDGSGQVLPTYHRGGRTYILGATGDRYEIRVRNRSDRRIEAVVSVDGRDAIDGKTADWSKRGYLVAPHDDVVIEGFRLSLDDVATFRFSSVSDSYASRMGSSRNVGVIGVAVFPEAAPPPEVSIPEADDSVGESSPGAGATGGAAPTPPAARASSAAPRAAQSESADESRPGLGTEFGERRGSEVTEVPFERARPDRPEAVLAVRYNDRAGLLALGIDVDGSLHAARDLDERETAEPFPVDHGRYSEPPPGWSAAR